MTPPRAPRADATRPRLAPPTVEVAPLPRGRHSLSRHEVATAQKLRLAVATAEAMAERGYAATPVADILARAKVSRHSFYEHYRDKQDCFLDALDLAGATLVAELQVTAPPPPADTDPTPSDPLAWATASIDRYLTTVAEQPAFARLFVVEVHAAGPEALARRAALQAALVDGLAEALGARDARDRFACTAFVAAVGALITVPVAQGDTRAILALREPLAQLLADLAATF